MALSVKVTEREKDKFTEVNNQPAVRVSLEQDNAGIGGGTEYATNAEAPKN